MGRLPRGSRCSLSLNLKLRALWCTRAFLARHKYTWPLLCERTGAEVWVKHENHTPTGAFKVRGGLVFVERLARERPNVAGIVSATRGNHGQSLAYAGRRYGVPVTIVAPHGNSAEKNAAMRAFGARLIEHGTDFETARDEAMRIAVADRLEFAPSFAPDLVTGVATYVLELFRSAPTLDALPCRSGLARGSAVRFGRATCCDYALEIVGVQATGADHARSLADGPFGGALNRAATEADGIAVRQPDAAALAMIEAGVARIVTVSDEAIAGAVRAYWTDTHNLVEGAGAAPLAALVAEQERMRGKRVGLVISGGNIDLALFRRWVVG